MRLLQWLTTILDAGSEKSVLQPPHGPVIGVEPGKVKHMSFTTQEKGEHG